MPSVCGSLTLIVNGMRALYPVGLSALGGYLVADGAEELQPKPLPVGTRI